jgi:hypothetical protein
MPERLEIGWGGSKIQKLKFDNIFLTDKEPYWQWKFNLKKKDPKTNIYRFN